MSDYEEGKLLDKTPCAEIRAELKQCLIESDCCLKLQKTPRQCMLNPEGSVPHQCFLLRTSFFECKRSIIDMRTRFRGRKCIV